MIKRITVASGKEISKHNGTLLITLNDDTVSEVIYTWDEDNGVVYYDIDDDHKLTNKDLEFLNNYIFTGIHPHLKK